MGDSGVQFPRGADGARPSLRVNQEIWADAAASVDPALALRIRESTSWRSDYVGAVRELTELGGRSPDAARRIAGAGLAAAGSRLVLAADGHDEPLSAALTADPGELDTRTLTGGGEPVARLEVPYLGDRLHDDALRRRLAVWVTHGVIEPSAAAALGRVIDHPEWLRLEGRRVVVLGAGAQTSPLEVLTSWGAEVVAVDLPVPAVQERIARAAAAGAGTVHVPLTAGRPGADLIEDVPTLAGWLGALADRPLVLGFYIYADGPLHVQATVAADLLATRLTDAGASLTTAFAGTPSDCYLVPLDVVEDSNARRRLRPRRAFELAVRGASAGRLYRPAYRDRIVESDDGTTMGVADALVGQQGPNYALAKRLQRWSTIDRWAAGRTGSFNVAPPTWTTSVTKNRILAAGYYGAHFAGLEVFPPETMQAVMSALLVHDLHRAPEAGHPELAVSANGVHGGYWRVPHDIRSTLFYTAALGLPRAFTTSLRAR